MAPNMVAVQMAKQAANAVVADLNITASQFATTYIPLGINLVRSTGYATFGDGGAAVYKRVVAQPSHLGRLQTVDGTWWELLPETFAGFNPRALGAKGDGVTSDVTAFDTLISILNVLGGTANKPLGVSISAGVYHLKAGGIRALTVSDISVRCDPAAIFFLRDGPLWTLGNGSTTVQNFWIIGGQPQCVPGDTIASTCSWVYGVNVARVWVDNQRYLNCQMFKGVSTTVLASIWLRGFSGSGPVDRHWCEIDTSGNANSSAAGLFLERGGGYAYVPPTNPAVSPKAITAITKANPAQVTCTAHGYTTGNRIRHGGIVGMTELNGVDATITVVDANNYTLNGINSTGYTAYSSGGWSVGLLWSYPYDTAIVGIKGHWDTAVISGGLYQHYPYLWSVEATGTVSFLFDEEVTWDYGGKGKFNFTLNGGSISNVKVDGGWHFCLNEDWIKITAPGAGSVTDITVRGHTLGMTGGHFIYDNLDKILNLEIDGLRVLGLGRARIGTCYLVRKGATGNNNATIRGVRCENPGGYYSNGATYLLADVAIQCGADTRYTVENNEVQAFTTHYNIPSTSTASARLRSIRNNKCRLGALPEYITTASATPPASTVAETNFTGLTKQINLYGGTMTAVAKNGTQISTGAGPFIFDVLPGETWSVTYSVTPTLVVSYKD